MPLGNLIEFIAGTSAQASEVNYNFNLVKSFVDSLEVGVTEVTNDIAQIQTQKANTNGDYRVRFSVADALNNYDAVNLQTLNNKIANSRGIIFGLGITKVGNTSIQVAAGTCYDSTYAKILSLSNAVSKTNNNQAASATYYVYIIGATTGTGVDILISSSSDEPALPADYTYYRRIGSYTTNSSNVISSVTNSQITQSSNGGDFINQNETAIKRESCPNWSGGWGININGASYTAPQYGVVYTRGRTPGTITLWINNRQIDTERMTQHTDGPCGTFYLKQGDVIKGQGMGSSSFFPCNQ